MKEKVKLYIKPPTLYKVRQQRNNRLLEAPKDATGYYRREVSADGTTITYRKVA